MTPTPDMPTKLDKIVAFLEVGADWAALLPIPGSAAASKITASLLRIIESGIKMHEAITGEPLDLSKLHELPPLE